MFYNELCGEKVSRLGFGLMRLPADENGRIEQDKVQEMVDRALAGGINYFDTAWPYHGGQSEIAIGKALAGCPRDSFYLADKFPAHQYMKSYDCAGIFGKQLEKCGVEYFDFYLLHNIYEDSFDRYKDESLGIVDYFVEQKKLGKIKHLGFSTHARAENLEEILDYLGDKIEFCQIQLNYLDHTMQNAAEKCRLLESRGIPAVIMEPLRGGKLANLPEEQVARLKAARPEESPASWSFRWLMQNDNSKVILSGMSTMEQLEDNLKTFDGGSPLSEEENELLLDVAEAIKDGVPCTACRYCCEGCPAELDIPMLIAGYNDYKSGSELTVSLQMDGTPKESWPNACIGCGACTHICPQHIDIPEVMKAFAGILDNNPINWRKMCAEREAAAEALAAKEKENSENA